jgi:hypothetical protein
VTRAEVVDVLAKCAAFDRRTVGEADVMAWHEVLADLDRDEALAAVTAHYRDSTEWLQPAHIRRLARTAREERRRAIGHDVRALPSRFEDDWTRDVRVREGVAQCRDVLAAVMARLEAKRGSDRHGQDEERTEKE